MDHRGAIDSKLLIGRFSALRKVLTDLCLHFRTPGVRKLEALMKVSGNVRSWRGTGLVPGELSPLKKLGYASQYILDFQVGTCKGKNRCDPLEFRSMIDRLFDLGTRISHRASLPLSQDASDEISISPEWITKTPGMERTVLKHPHGNIPEQNRGELFAYSSAARGISCFRNTASAAPHRDSERAIRG